MKCVICKGDDIRLKEVKEELFNGGDVVFITIEVPVCQTCGERYYDRRTMLKLEEAAQRLRDRELETREIGRVLEAV